MKTENYFLLYLENIIPHREKLNIFGLSTSNIYYPRLVLYNNTFYQNFADYGGALNINEYEVIIINCLFVENLGNICGGALLISTQIANISKCQFVRNEAGFGGGVYFDVQPLKDLNECRSVSITNTIFYSNSAYSFGGSLYNFRDMKGFTFTYSEVYFFKNIALIAGSISLFDLNATHHFDKCRFVNNLAELAGAMYFLSDSSYYFSNCHFISNAAISIKTSVLICYYVLYNQMISTLYSQFGNFSYDYLIINSEEFIISDLSIIIVVPDDESSDNQAYFGGVWIQDIG